MYWRPRKAANLHNTTALLSLDHVVVFFELTNIV
jgi:hypothetical protein